MDSALRRAVAALATAGVLALAPAAPAQQAPPPPPTAPQPPAAAQPAPRTWSEAHAPTALQDDSGLPGTGAAAALPPLKRLPPKAMPPSRLPPLHHLPSGRITGASVPGNVLPVQFTSPPPPPGGAAAVNGAYAPGQPAPPAPGGQVPRPAAPIAQSAPWAQPPQGSAPAGPAPYALTAPPRPSHPINMEQLRRQVAMMCGQLGSEVRVYPGPDQFLHVRVRVANAGVEKFLSDRILQIPEMQEPGVRLEMELAR